MEEKVKYLMVNISYLSVQAALLNKGDDVSIIAMGRMVLFAEESIIKLKSEGINCDLIDLRTTSPLDENAILDSVEKTGRVVIVDESTPRCSLASDIAGFIVRSWIFVIKSPCAASNFTSCSRTFCT